MPVPEAGAPVRTQPGSARRTIAHTGTLRLFCGIPHVSDRDPKLIRSRENPRFKVLRQLATSTRERRKAGLALLDGVHLISAYRASGYEKRVAAQRQAKRKALGMTEGASYA